MNSTCEDTDFMYPMKADLYFPIITQNSYGQVSKDWVFDRSITVNATPIVKQATEEITPNTYLSIDGLLSARVKNDPRLSSQNSNNAITNILITNVRDSNDNIIYRETAGPRSGRGTIYEVATVEPFIGPFGNIEHFRMVLRRTENQAVGD